MFKETTGWTTDGMFHAGDITHDRWAYIHGEWIFTSPSHKTSVGECTEQVPVNVPYIVAVYKTWIWANVSEVWVLAVINYIIYFCYRLFKKLHTNGEKTQNGGSTTKFSCKYNCNLTLDHTAAVFTMQFPLCVLCSKTTTIIKLF